MLFFFEALLGGLLFQKAREEFKPLTEEDKQNNQRFLMFLPMFFLGGAALIGALVGFVGLMALITGS